LRRIAKRRAALDAEEARWLLIAKRENVHAHLGYGSFAEYVERVLGHERQVAVERLRVAEALEDLPLIKNALATGAACYSAVRELTRFVTADREHEWLEKIENKTMREIEDLVAGRKPGDGPEDRPDPKIVPVVVRLELMPDVYASFLEARRTLQAETGEKLDDNALIAALCEGRAGSNERAPYQIALTICDHCDRATQDAAGRVIAVAPSVVERARCDADHVGHLDAEKPARLTTDIPESVRRLVHRRDHNRCTVPGCRASAFLEIHHIVSREEGGDHSPANLTLLCGAHHRLRHDNKLAVTGLAPDRLRFTHADGHAYGSDFFTEAERALRTLGFPAATAKAAVDRARPHVGADVRHPDVIRACLRECPRPSG
jgi:hypothetical protein